MKSYSQKIKHHHHRKIDGEYFRQRESANIRKKNKGSYPVLEATRMGYRKVEGSEERIYHKGANVEYKGQIARVTKVDQKGIWVERFHKADDKGISYPSGKQEFIPEKKVEKQVSPLFTNMPIPVTVYPPFYIK